LIGNPYASSIDWNQMIGVTSNNIAPTYTAWDPMVNVRGAYVSYNGSTNSNSTSKVDNNIQSGQAFFVQTAGSNPKLTFLEAYKTSVRTQVFRIASERPKLTVQLLLNEKAGIQNTADGLVAVFDEGFKTEIGDEDSYKFTNLDENMAIDRGGVSLSIEGRPIIKGSDTIPLKMWQFRQKSYFLKIAGVNFSRDVTAFVKDAYLGVETPINLETGTIIPFSITSEAASSARNRFTIIFNGSKALPVVVTDIKASLKDKGVKVEWTSHTETNIDRYEIERSEDAINFVKQRVVVAKGNNATIQLYEWIDQTPVTGTNFYRIKIIEKSGEVTYTGVVKVDIAKTAGSITVYPNPVRGNTFSVNVKNMEKGRYSIILYNNAGQIVFNDVINHDGRNTPYPVTTKITSKAIYRLHVSNGNIDKTSLVLFN
jgi:hypothetical protein